MAKPLTFAMAVFLLWSASSAEHPGWKVTFPASAHVNRSCAPGEDEPLRLRLPTMDLETDLKPVRLIRGRVDPSGMKGDHPILVPPAAHPLLGRPGEIGVALILGHRQWRAKPLVFARLERLALGDPVIVTGGGISLLYEVTGRLEIEPRRIWRIVGEIGRKARGERASVLILMTCAPYGGNWRRLLVFAACGGVEEDALARGWDHPSPQ